MAKSTVTKKVRTNTPSGLLVENRGQSVPHKTAKTAAASALTQRSATAKAKKIIAENAKRHSAALIRLADR